MYNFKKLKELRRKATTDEKMNGSFVRDVGVQPKDPQTAIQEVNYGDKKKVDYYKAMGKKPLVPNKVKKPGCESVEHSLQELSKHKLARYQMKAAENLRFKAVDHGAAIAQAAAAGGDMKKNDPDMGKRSKKLDKRIIGISRAANKLTQKTNEEKQKPFRSLIGPEGPGMKRLRAKQDAIPMTDKSGRISRSRMQKKFGRFINTEDHNEAVNYSLIGRPRGRTGKVVNRPTSGLPKNMFKTKDAFKKKDVKEETLDELSIDTLKSYEKKALDDRDKAPRGADGGLYSHPKARKRMKGVFQARSKINDKKFNRPRVQPKSTNEETLDELEQKTYMSYLSKSRGRVKSKPSVSKSRGHAIKKTPEIHKRLFGDKEYEKHIKKMSEDGHADVASALRKCKTIMEDASDIHTKLAMMGTMDSLPSWWTNKLAVAAAYMDSMRDYLLYPTNEEVKDEKYLKKLKQTKDQATLGDMSTGIQKGGFQGRGMYEAKKVKTMKKVARDKLIGKKDPFEPEPSITTQVIRTDSPDNVVK